MSAGTDTAQAEIQIIDRVEAAAAMMNPIRLAILSELVDPGSSTSVGKTLDLPRQKVNYHVRELEKQGLVTKVGERAKHGCTERLVQSRARSFMVDPAAFGPMQARTGDLRDRLSSAYLLTAATKTIRDVARLRRGADRAKKKVATFTAETEVRFRSPAEQAAFLGELSEALTGLVERYHAGPAEEGRTYRIMAAGHPAVPDTED